MLIQTKKKRGRKPRPKSETVQPVEVVRVSPSRVIVRADCPRCGAYHTGRTGYDATKQRQRRECKACGHTFWVDRRE